MDPRGVREVVRAAIDRLAPDELSFFDEVWDVYLDDPRDCADILRHRDTPLGSGMAIIATSMTPLVAAITGEALASLVKEPTAKAGRKLGRLVTTGRAKKKEARQAALSGPAPDPAALEHAVMRALFLDIARKANCPDESAVSIANTLTDVFTERPGGQHRPGTAPRSP